jgi:DNA-binding NarL/FixJ family response regulator
MRLSRPDIAILVFTRHPDIADATTDGLELPPGVGFLRKHLVSDQTYLIEAMERVLLEQEDLVVEDQKSGDAFAFLGANGSRTLRLIAEGYDNEEIARRCGVSRKTVERWIEQVYRDLGIDTKGSLNPRVAAARRFFFAVGVPGSPE